MSFREPVLNVDLDSVKLCKLRKDEVRYLIDSSLT